MQDFQRRLIDAAQTSASMQDAILKNKTRTGQVPIMVQNYSYVGDLAGVVTSAGAGQQLQIPTNGDSDFIIVYMSGLVFDSAAHTQIIAPFCKLQITDNSSQRAMFSNPVLFSLVCGNAGFPYILQEPRLITANTAIIVQFYNFLAANVDMEIAFSGYRVYY